LFGIDPYNSFLFFDGIETQSLYQKMFKVQGNDYPIQLQPIYSGSGVFLFNSNNYNTASILNIKSFFDDVEITPTPLPNTCPVFIKLNDGTILTPAPTIDDLEENTFYCENGNITFYSNPIGLTQYIYPPLPRTTVLPTTYLAPPYPLIYSQYVIDGAVTYNRTWKGHPSTEFTFTTFDYLKDTVLEAFRIGKNFTITNINYQVTGFSLSELNERKYPQNLITVSVSFSGKWDSVGDKNILDRPISLKNIYDEYPLDNNGNHNLSQLANCLGINIYGDIPIIKIPSDVDSKSTTTLRQELESRAITTLSYPYYSNDNIELRRWKQYGGKFIADRDIINEDAIEIEYSGNSYPYQGIQLVKELWNAKVELAQENDEEIGEEDYILWETQNALSVYDVEHPVKTRNNILEGLIYLDKDILRMPNANFDNGGLTKTLRKRTFRNGTETTTEEWIWGFNFTSSQVYDIDIKTIAPNVFEYSFDYNIEFANSVYMDQYWQNISYKKTSKGYDATENEYGVKEYYLTLETTEGWTYLRLAQESEALETAQAKLDYESEKITLSEYNKVLEKYTAQKYTLNSPIVTYELEPLANYYTDIPAKTPDDDKYVIPKFVKSKKTEENVLEVKPDPTATTDNPKPDLVIRNSFTHIEKTLIVTPRNKEAKRRTPEIYQVTNYILSNSNSGDRNEFTVTQNAGRPPIQERLDLSIKPFSEKPDPTNKDTNFVLNTPNSNKDVYGNTLRTCGEIEGETLSYPDIFDVDKIIEIAEVDLAMQNIDAITVKLTLGRKYDLEEGNVVLWRNKYWLVKDITESHEIEKGRVRLADYSITLGCYFNRIPLTKTKVLNNN